MASTAGGSIAVTDFPSSYIRRKARASNFTTMTIGKLVTIHKSISCSAVQESSTPAVAIETKDKEPSAAEAAPTAPAKPKPKPKAPVKPLHELMEEEVIPSLKSTLESQNDIFDLELSFADNKLEGSFVKKGNPYTFWAFFPDGVLTGPKGFSMSSYGMEASTIEPFLVDEKKITAKHVVFWVEKRLAAQGIIPVWSTE